MKKSPHPMCSNIFKGFLKAKKGTHALSILCTLFFVVPSKIVSLEIIRRLIGAVGDGDMSGVRHTIIGLAVLCCTSIAARLSRDVAKFKLVMGLCCKIEDASIKSLKLSPSDKSTADLVFGKIQNTVEKYSALIYEQITAWFEAAFVITLISLYIGSFDLRVLLGIYAISLVLLGLSLRKAKLVPAAKEAFELEAIRATAVSMEYINNAEVASFLDNSKLFAPFVRQADKMSGTLLRLNKVNNQVRLFGRFAFIVTISLYFVYLFLTTDREAFILADALVMVMAIPILTDGIFRVPMLIFERKSVKGMENIVNTLLPEDEHKETDYSCKISEGVNLSSQLPLSEIKRTDAYRNISGGIEIKNLRFSYESQDRVLEFDHGCVKQGELTFVVGPSGSGKTTLLKLCAGVLAPLEGEVLWGGVPIKKQPQDTLILLEPVCFADSLAANIALSDSVCKSKLAQVMKKVGLDEVFKNSEEWFTREVSPGQLSTGEIQKVSLARAFYHNHKNWFFDEVTSAIDKPSETQVLEAIRTHAKDSGGIVMVSTHNLDLIKDGDAVIYVRLDGVCT